MPSQWVHRCSLQWARWQRLLLGNENVLASGGNGNKRRTCRFVSLVSAHPHHFSTPFLIAGPPYYFSSHLSCSSYVRLGHQHPISRPVYPFSNMLLVFTVRVLSLFFYSARISILFLFFSTLLYIADKDVKLPPCFFFVHIVIATFFPP